MRRVRVDEATPVQLNWLVGTLEGRNITLMRNDDASLFPMPVWADGIQQLNYSTFWAQGGPIIEREELVLDLNGKDGWVSILYREEGDSFNGYGPTPLIAAMRCYVESKLGEEVEVPDDLTS